jgi:hypothetical protein
MPEWIRVGRYTIFNLDHIVAVRKKSDGTAAIITTHTPSGSYTQTDILYDDLVEAIETISGR